MLNAAFIFIAPAADPAVHRSTIHTPQINLTTIGVATFEEGAAAAKEMVDQGCTAIELCGGFGIRGTYLVEQAVSGRARVGSVRFDIHPGLDNKSGDEVFL
ncbi:MAG: hypothetical protein IJV40_14680 [Oscillospiraceae bacterium]|nr:hypothetical protein [Oscillospiraceae bacterium]